MTTLCIVALCALGVGGVFQLMAFLYGLLTGSTQADDELLFGFSVLTLPGQVLAIIALALYLANA